MGERLRIDKLLAHMGFGTRSELKKAVKQGKVVVDGKLAKDSGLIVDPELNVVEFEGERVKYRSVAYYMLNKPPGIVSATEDHRDRTVIDLLQPEDRLLAPFPVGRLDKDTVGLLLLTNDGQLAHELLSPRKHVAKTYEARVRGAVGDEDVRQFAAGAILEDGYECMSAELTVLEQEERGGEIISSISLTIMEGKFHQVKRMFESVGKTVLYLKRTSMGPLQLDSSLAEGEYRELTEEELELLKQHRGTVK